MHKTTLGLAEYQSLIIGFIYWYIFGYQNNDILLIIKEMSLMRKIANIAYLWI
jgi:hypothetical protein